MEDNLKKQNKENLDESKKEEQIHLPKDLEDLIKFIPDDKKIDAIKIISSLSIKTASSFSGPLPHPSILGDYNDIIKYGAERIMKMAENQSSHRIELEKHAIKEELKQSRFGQIYGFILALVGMGIAFGLAFLGHDTVAGIFGTSTIVGLVTIFVIGKKRQNKELEE